ncbi:DUF1254 domain-containing protein [Rhizobium leguminosarum]
MRTTRKHNLLATAVISALALSTTGARADDVDTRIGTLSFTHDLENGYPTKETVEKLFDERDFQRATQIYLWALPMVSIGEAEHVMMEAPGAAPGDIIRVDTVPGIARFLTGNATTPYLMTWLNLENSGPVVIEMPAGPAAGFVDDLWQRPVTDIGQPGPDKGRGGKFLVLGPGQTAPEGADAYIVVQSTTFNNLWLVRLLSPDAKEREAMLAKIRMYPVSQRANPAVTKVHSLGGGPSFANAPRGLAYWERLSH